MLCLSMSVERLSGVELLLAGLTLTLSMRHTPLVEHKTLMTLAADIPLPPVLLSTDWLKVSFL